MKYRIWNKIDEIIKGVSADYIIKSHNIRNDDEVFLVIDDYGKVNQIEIVRIIKSVYGFDPNLTAEETAQAYLNLKKEEENNAIKDQETLEEQAKKIDILEAEKEKLKASLEVTQKAVDFMMMNNGGM